MTISYYDAIVEQSKAEGRMEGRKEGRKEGHTEGHKEGHTEGDRQRLVSMVMKMVENGLPLALIATCAELPLQEVQKIIKTYGAHD